MLGGEPQQRRVGGEQAPHLVAGLVERDDRVPARRGGRQVEQRRVARQVSGLRRVDVLGFVDEHQRRVVEALGEVLLERLLRGPLQPALVREELDHLVKRRGAAAQLLQRQPRVHAGGVGVARVGGGHQHVPPGRVRHVALELVPADVPLRQVEVLAEVEHPVPLGRAVYHPLRGEQVGDRCERGYGKRRPERREGAGGRACLLDPPGRLLAARKREVVPVEGDRGGHLPRTARIGLDPQAVAGERVFHPLVGEEERLLGSDHTAHRVQAVDAEVPADAGTHAGQHDHCRDDDPMALHGLMVGAVGIRDS
ncbi:hypothetical protein Phou_095980 [Phytohabitans houttuyneae]|uniref:Uncharacterized protein n=1 Tax=Phytohabitans houttuyneae TaxID=1076126 RepID=A0A6V8KS02_9ACTN|nr:hypothetical protein Phou_095980 [Phytohabitans houttuyneae]